MRRPADALPPSCRNPGNPALSFFIIQHPICGGKIDKKPYFSMFSINNRENRDWP
jgi:hypothetical protein